MFLQPYPTFVLSSIVCIEKKYNFPQLFRNGTGDEATMHAGCPVLIGSKWIANQWFRERGQEHARKCDLEHDL